MGVEIVKEVNNISGISMEINGIVFNCKIAFTAL